MANQGMRLVLSQNTDSTNAGIDAVRQWKIDDAEFAAEVEPRLFSYRLFKNFTYL